MKKLTMFITFLMMGGTIFASSLQIHKTDGSTVEVPISDIQSITFSEAAEGSIETLLEWMTGSFSSEAQAETSTDPYHVDVRLHMVRIWTQRPGYWVYIEQAYASSPSNPYRQRIYRVFSEDGVMQDEIYSIPNASSFVGSYESPEDFDSLHTNISRFISYS
jgi:hypothetical protein